MDEQSRPHFARWDDHIMYSEKEVIELFDKLDDVQIKYFYEETQRVFDDNDIRQWPISPVVDAPTQKNSFDCGMFVCKYMEAVVQPQGVIWEDLKTWQDSMSKFRVEFAFALFCNTLR
ncbi:hypothetical protein IEQ34_019095 [Dendrobium chrysotoxum]|uniref:Ubiquitin-like protease family profile domain-containing protein n=1 Tax=Dendrobium chrysotoxum TaxID=161865 RepID=A0AAV7G604_DENCH|nr:hypothetical protein IEQ34_019095 [Dendrobium chrysotoxum]